ncbi:uncharacterized protein [Mytilus edulis]|uniref:uncharacterized protein n=1 Tax=Mytilus edulis TaxID=6550 RepID=UPI0039F050CF
MVSLDPQYKTNGRTEIAARSGPKPVLSTTEESRIVEWCIEMAKIGYPRTRYEWLHIVKKILDDDGRQTKFRDNLPGKDWYYSFKSRHPEISERTPNDLGEERAMVSSFKIKKWFEDFSKYMAEEVEGGMDILKDPSRLYNADESGFPLCPKTSKVLTMRGKGFPSSRQHASHIMQPLDLCLFSSLKYNWRKSVRTYQMENPGETVTKAVFAKVFKSAWDISANVENAVKGFKEAGLFHYKPSAVIENPKLEPSCLIQSSSTIHYQSHPQLLLPLMTMLQFTVLISTVTVTVDDNASSATVDDNASIVSTVLPSTVTAAVDDNASIVTKGKKKKEHEERENKRRKEEREKRKRQKEKKSLKPKQGKKKRKNKATNNGENKSCYKCESEIEVMVLSIKCDNCERLFHRACANLSQCGVLEGESDPDYFECEFC